MIIVGALSFVGALTLTMREALPVRPCESATMIETVCMLGLVVRDELMWSSLRLID